MFVSLYILYNHNRLTQMHVNLINPPDVLFLLSGFLG